MPGRAAAAAAAAPGGAATTTVGLMESGVPCASGAPQKRQERLSSGLGVAQAGQAIMARLYESFGMATRRF